MMNVVLRQRILFTHHSDYEAHFEWRSPVVYLFIAVTAMLFLVAFASLVLVCTWCRFSNSNVVYNAQMGENESTRRPQSDSIGPVKAVVDEDDDEEQGKNMLVIMPGEEKPTFVATQVASAPHAAESRG